MVCFIQHFNNNIDDNDGGSMFKPVTMDIDTRNISIFFPCPLLLLYLFHYNNTPTHDVLFNASDSNKAIMKTNSSSLSVSFLVSQVDVLL
jgi:hypothetical protein